MNTVVEDQARMALGLANEHKDERCQLLRALKRGEVSELDLVLSPPACIASMFVFDFVRQVPQVGVATVREINREAVRAGINLAMSLGELTTGRREWLAHALQHRRRRPRLASRPQG